MSNESKGLHCPQCNFKIKFSLEELLMSGRITCPNCHLQMDMNVPTELKTHFLQVVIQMLVLENSILMVLNLYPC